MKKYICAILAFILVLSAILPVSAAAATPRVMSIIPGLSFSGTTAYCELQVNTDSLDNDIYATIKLWNGSKCVAIWGTSGKGYLSYSATRTVSKNTTYTLTADVTINGVAEPQVSITRTCN